MIEHLTLPKGANGSAAPDPTQFCWFIDDVYETLGERFALFDDDGGRIEALCFRPDLSATPGFEAALRHGLRELASVSPFAAARVRISDREAADLTATILSDVPEGVRVSEILGESAPPDSCDPATAIALACEVLVAVSTLSPIVHGALSAERLVMTAARRIAILDSGMAAALRTIPNTRARLWDDLLIPMPPGTWSSPPFSVRSDAMQAAIVVLELLLGRRLDTREFPGALPSLAREAAERAASIMPPAALREWFDRALSISHASFRDAADAFEALIRCPGCPTPDTRRTALAALATAHRLRGVEREIPEPEEPEESAEPEPVDAPAAEHPPHAAAEYPPHAAAEHPPHAAGEHRPHANLNRFSALTHRADDAFGDIVPAVPTRWPKAAAAAAVLALVLAGGVMALRGSRTTPAPVTVTQTPVAGAPSEPARSPESPSAAATAVDRPVAPPAPRPPAPEAVAPIVLPPTPAPVPDRTLRTKPVVPPRPAAAPSAPVRAGRSETPAAALTGIAHFNATPWANVSVDGSPRGQTPLGNVTLPVGTHDVVFSHPDLGTIRRTITVTADVPTRLSVNMGPQ